MIESNAVVAIFKSHIEAESAVTELHRAGLDMKRISIVGRDYYTDANMVGYYNAGDRMKFWGKWVPYGVVFWGCCWVRGSFWYSGSGRYSWLDRWLA